MSKNTIYAFTGSELDIQKHIVENIDDISKNCFFGGVKKTLTNLKIKGDKGHGVYDILVYHEDLSATLIEVKKYTSDMHVLSAIGQILFYAELCKIHLSNYPRLVIASNHIPLSIQAVVKANNLHIRLLEIDGDKITLF